MNKMFLIHRDSIEAHKGSGDDVLEGRIRHFDTLVFELLTIIAWDQMRFSVELRYIHKIIDAQYFAVRCVLDCASPSVLRLCLVSESYLREIWLPYMRITYPTIFVSTKPASETP